MERLASAGCGTMLPTGCFCGSQQKRVLRMSMARAIKVLGVVTMGVAVAGLLGGCGKKDAGSAGAAPVKADIQPGFEAVDDAAAAKAVDAQDAASAADVVLVTVDGQSLTQSEANVQVNQRMMQMSRQMPIQQLQAMAPQLSRQVIDEFVAQVLLSKQATAEAIEVDEAEIDAVIDDFAKRLPEGTTIESVLAGRQMTIEQARADIRKDQAIRKLLTKNLPEEFEVSDEAVEAFYQERLEEMKVPESVRARHILIKVEADDDEAAKAAKREKAVALKKQLDDGADFNELAKAESACPSGAQGGELGTFGRGEMVPPFDAAAFGQPVEAIGDVVETNFGYHVIQVLERTAETTRPLEEVQEGIRDHLENQQRNAAFIDYIESLKSGAEIVYPGAK